MGRLPYQIGMDRLKLSPLQPQRPTRVSKKPRIRLDNQRVFQFSHIVIEHDDCPVIIIGKKSSEGVDLIPRTSLLDDSIPGIFERPKDVVKMYYNPRSKIRQNIKQFVTDITAGSQNMRRVNE